MKIDISKERYCKISTDAHLCNVSTLLEDINFIVLIITITYITQLNHDDVIKWKHIPRYWPFVRGIHRSPVGSPHKGQRRGALMFSLICAWLNGWVNNREAGDLRRHCAHNDVIIMFFFVKISIHGTVQSQDWELSYGYICVTDPLPTLLTKMLDRNISISSFHKPHMRNLH